jgi:alpha-beta hydrolase superfamily lysophospholipase/SAM-dependent methyltransferase
VSNPQRTSTAPTSPSPPTEQSFTLPDGSQLRYRAWLPPGPATKMLVVLHQVDQPSDRVGDLVGALGFADVAVIAGELPGADRQVGSGDGALAFAATVKRLDRFMHHLAQTFRARWEDTVVLASRAGALALAGWVHDYAPRIRAMVLAAPAFPTKSRLVIDAAAIRIPTLVLTAGKDPLVRFRPQRRFFERLASPIKRMKAFPGMRDDLFCGADCPPVVDELRRFIVDALQRETAPPPLVQGDRYSYVQDEYDRLIAPLPALSPAWCFYKAATAVNRALALVCTGMRLGWRTGFDSGQMLDYAYENQAHGITPLDRWIDRIFLNNVGWRAVRRRRENMGKLLRAAIDKVRSSGEPVRLVDIAAGPGRYLLETIRAMGGNDISALLRDNEPANLDAGQKLAEQMGLKRVEFQWGDAFNEASLAAIQPAPNLAVACGLYELFGDNQMVLCSLRGLAAALRGGGYLLYTGQPWHPNLEMIARTLTNRDGAPLVMRRRTQEELDDLVRAAGFEKIDMEIDEFGVFTVSLARAVVRAG